MFDNLFGPIRLAMICKRIGIHLTYLGTGCIFEYDKDHQMTEDGSGEGFREDELPNFFGSGYSVKGFAILMSEFTDCLNLRIRMPITPDYNPRNFITRILNYEKICQCLIL